MKTIQINLFTYDELNEKAKQKVINHVRNNCLQADYSWECELLKDTFAEIIKENGYEIDYSYGNKDIQFDLSYSQGNHVTFKVKQMLSKEFIENINFEHELIKDLAIKYDLHLVIKGWHDIEIFWETYDTDEKQYCDKLDELKIKLELEVGKHYRSLCKKLMKQGYDHFEEIESDEYIIEWLKDEYMNFNYDQYLESGEIFHG